MRKFEDMMAMLLDIYNKPTKCEQCGGEIVYQGCGEYMCQNCKHIEYDDYGKVRNYVERHPNLTVAEVADATGVKTDAIRTMLKEHRLRKR